MTIKQHPKFDGADAQNPALGRPALSEDLSSDEATWEAILTDPTNVATVEELRKELSSLAARGLLGEPEITSSSVTLGDADIGEGNRT